MDYLNRFDNFPLAYNYIPANEKGSHLPAIMFLGGFRSNMMGTKATYLKQICYERGQAFVRFDYTGHGASGGAFIDGTIGQWKQDSLDILDSILQGEVVLVGSSMGGWISLLLLFHRPDRIKGIITIAGAPDFTSDIEAALDRNNQEKLIKQGFIQAPSSPGYEAHIFTRELLEEGRFHSILHGSYNIEIPLVIIHGKMDKDVPYVKALQIQQAFQGPDTEIIFIEDGDHSLSRSDDLALLNQAICKVCKI